MSGKVSLLFHTTHTGTLADRDALVYRICCRELLRARRKGPGEVFREHRVCVLSSEHAKARSGEVVVGVGH